MSALIIWQAVSLVSQFRQSRSLHLNKLIDVTVQGNVMKPGTYRVPEGTTQYEILKVAGVRTTSDLSNLALNQELSANQNLSVGSRNTPVKMNAFLRLEFFLAGLAIETPDGMERPVQEGISIEQGDKVSTMTKSQAEISINSLSRIDMDGNTEITVEKISVENGIRTIDIFQRSGMCWYKIAYSGKDEVIRIFTPFAVFTARGKGADLTVTLKKNGAGVDCRDGVVVVERQRTGEKLNLMAGQRVIAYSDERPFDITRAATDAALPSKFSQLNKKKPETVTKQGQGIPTNILICAFPQTFQLINISFENGKMHAVNIPAETYVGDFASGFSTMGESFLYGGIDFTTSIVERMLNIRINKYAVIEKEDISRVAGAMGGVNIIIDQAAAAVLRLSAGSQKLKDDNLVAFLRPGISGDQDAARRQSEILRALFESFRSKSIVMTGLMADQILSTVESNINAGEMLQYYSKFSTQSSWEYINHPLPSKSLRISGKLFNQPLIDECRKLLPQAQ
jgi:LCP family protein required for cell wall assembly